MNIYSCGCSFMSLDSDYPGTHFTEIVSKQLTGNLTSLARPGSSNFYIALQVDHAIQQRPDLILVLFTNYDRIEILKPNQVYDVKQGYKEIGKTAMSNVITNYIDQSLVEEPKKDALKKWFGEVYDFGLAFHRDYYLCLGVLSRLEQSRIPFVFNFGGMRYFSVDSEVWWKNHSNSMAKLNPWDYTEFSVGNTSGVYHTSFDSQRLIADNWLTKISI